MTNDANANVGSLLVGEYVDEAEPRANLAPHQGEVVRPEIVANYLDLWAGADNIREFTVLLKDGRVVVVRGQSLKHLPSTVAGESGSYGVIVRTGGEEMLIAIFHTDDVIGIFHGQMSSDRKSA